MKRQTGQKTKPKIQVPGISVIIIIIIVAVLGFKTVSFVSGYFAERHGVGSSRSTVSTGSAKFRTASSSSGVQPDRDLSYYEMITERNLLRPLGWEKPVETPRIEKPVIQRRQPRERPIPVDELILTGIVHLDNESIALVEDVSSGKAYFLRKGDKLRNYSVEAIAEENIVLVNEDSKLTHALGAKVQYNSNRQISTSEQYNNQTTNDTAQNADTESDSQDEGDTANLSLIERMKARRRRELGQQ